MEKITLSEFTHITNTNEKIKEEISGTLANGSSQLYEDVVSIAKKYGYEIIDDTATKTEFESKVLSLDDLEPVTGGFSFSDLFSKEGLCRYLMGIFEADLEYCAEKK